MANSPDQSDLGKAGPPPCPEGGLQGWLVVVGAMMIMGCCFGYVSSFGIFETYYLQNQLSHKTSSDIAWIGSCLLCFQFASGLIAGCLFDRYGARVLIVPASLAYVLSMMMTSICKEYYQFILAQGILGGISSGFLFTPAMGAVNHYFMKKRGAALGCVAVGSSIGGVVFPIVLENTFYSRKVGFGWGVRIAGFGTLVFLSVACVLIKERLGPRKGSFFILSAFLQPSYSVLVAGIFLLIWGMFIPFFFVSEYAIKVVHMSDSMAFYLLAILNGLSAFGRITSGLTADKLGWLNLLSVFGLANGILIFCWPSTHTNAGLIVWTATFGFFSGAIYALFPASLASVTPEPCMIGAYIGQAMAVLAIGALTGSPIAGAIIAKSGFRASTYFAGTSMLVGSVMIMAARFLHRPSLMVKA
ncbi:hypothetical protein MBLNU459_g4078t1 [Dothideomycetes sp. NU459]